MSAQHSTAQHTDTHTHTHTSYTHRTHKVKHRALAQHSTAQHTDAHTHTHTHTLTHTSYTKGKTTCAGSLVFGHAWGCEFQKRGKRCAGFGRIVTEERQSRLHAHAFVWSTMFCVCATCKKFGLDSEYVDIWCWALAWAWRRCKECTVLCECAIIQHNVFDKAQSVSMLFVWVVCMYVWTSVSRLEEIRGDMHASPSNKSYKCGPLMRRFLHQSPLRTRCLLVFCFPLFPLSWALHRENGHVFRRPTLGHMPPCRTPNAYMWIRARIPWKKQWGWP